MSITLEQTGRLQAYEAAGKTVEQFLIEQKIPSADQAEARELWADIEQTRKDHPDDTMMVPSD